jgi:hypothetical protein
VKDSQPSYNDDDERRELGKAEHDGPVRAGRTLLARRSIARHRIPSTIAALSVRYYNRFDG